MNVANQLVIHQHCQGNRNHVDAQGIVDGEKRKPQCHLADLVVEIVLDFFRDHIWYGAESAADPC